MPSRAHLPAAARPGHLAAPRPQSAAPSGALQRAIASPRSASPAQVQALQRLYGNRATSRGLAAERGAEPPVASAQPARPVARNVVQRLRIKVAPPGKGKEKPQEQQEYTYPQVVELVLRDHWPNGVERPADAGDLVPFARELEPDENATVRDLPQLGRAIAFRYRLQRNGFRSEWEMLLAATQFPRYDEKRADELMRRLFADRKELTPEETDQLYSAMLAPGPKVVQDTDINRLVTDLIRRHGLKPATNFKGWQTARAQANQLAVRPPAAVAQAAGPVVVRPGDKGPRLTVEEQVLKFLLERRAVGEFRPTTHAARGALTLVPHNPAQIALLRLVSRRLRSMVDQELPFIPQASAQHQNPVVGQGRQLIDRHLLEMRQLIEALTRRHPPAQCAYINLGNSPTPVMALLERLDPQAMVRYLPLSTVKGDPRQFIGPGADLWDRPGSLLAQHFERFLPTIDELGGRSVVLIDYASLGTALTVGMHWVRRYYQALAARQRREAPGVHVFALTTVQSPLTYLPRNDANVVTHSLGRGKTGLGGAMEGQALKAAGLKSSGKVDLASLTGGGELPPVQLDLVGLVRLLAQIEIALRRAGQSQPRPAPEPDKK